MKDATKEIKLTVAMRKQTRAKSITEFKSMNTPLALKKQSRPNSVAEIQKYQKMCSETVIKVQSHGCFDAFISFSS